MNKLLDINESYTDLISDDIELKKKIADNLSILVDGYKYTPEFRAGIWDGKKRFYQIVNYNIRIPKGMVPYVIKYLDKKNISYEYKSTFKEYSITKKELEDFVKGLDLPFKPYDYQMDAVYYMIKEKRLTLRSATGSGKSLMAYIFFMYMKSKNFKSLLVVPSINLVDQMFDDFKDYGMKNAEKYIKLIGGEHKESKDLSEKPIVISTWQSLNNIKSKELEIFDNILVDECHTAKSDVLNSIIKYSKNAQWKIGMTGTVPKNKVERLQLISTLGKVKTIITPGGLIKLGLATPISITTLYLNYSDLDIETFNRNKNKYPDEVKFIEEHYYRNKKVANILTRLGKKENTLGLYTHTKHGEMLLKYCVEERTGHKKIVLLKKITPKPIKEAYNEWQEDKERYFYLNTVLEQKDIDKIEKMLSKEQSKEDIREFLENVKSLDDISIFFVNGEVKSSDREYIRKNLEKIHIDKINIKSQDEEIDILNNTYVETNKGKILATDLKKGDIIKKEWLNKNFNTNKDLAIKEIKKYLPAIILGNYAVVSTGANYKNLHSIVYCSSLKSYTKIVQSIGRGMRLHASKSGFEIYDCVDILSKNEPNYTLKHFYERLEYYREDEYPIKEKELKLEGDVQKYELELMSEEW